MSLISKDETAEALALRVAELSTVLKQQRDQIEEQKAVLDQNRSKVKEQQEVIRLQEAQLLERDAQLQAQNAEIRALRRQHALDAEGLRSAHSQLQAPFRPLALPCTMYDSVCLLFCVQACVQE